MGTSSEHAASPPPTRRRRLRFSLRTLLLATTLLCLFLGWYIPRVQNQRRAADVVRAAGGKAIYAWQIRPDDAPPDYQPDPPGPNFLRAWFGPHWFDAIVEVRLNGHANQVPKNRFSYVGPHLVNLPSLRDLSLWGTRLDASDCQLLIDLDQVESLRLGMATELSPANAAILARMSNVRTLHVRSAKILTPALIELSHFENLEELLISCDSYHRRTGETIEEYQLCDEAAAAIAAFPKLRKLNLYSTRITDVGIRRHLRQFQIGRVRGQQPTHHQRCVRSRRQASAIAALRPLGLENQRR